jgi:hypothetical protein
VLTPSPECQGIAPVALAVNGWEREDNTALAACYHYTGMLNETPGHPLVHRFRIPVSASRRYSILGARGPQRVLLAAADVQVRLLPAE